MTPYGEVVARNIRSARSRKGIGQDEVAARMRAQGHRVWIRQTVSSTEKGKRRPLAEEIPGLAAALETSILALLSPTDDDTDLVEFPAGDGNVEVMSVERWISAVNAKAIRWAGDRPVLTDNEKDVAAALAALRAHQLSAGT